MDDIVTTAPSFALATVLPARRQALRAARAAVPRLADFCIVHLRSHRGLIAVAGAHATREGGRLLRTLMHAYRIRPSDRDSTVAHVVRSGRPALRRSISTAADDDAPAGSVSDLHRRLAPVSALVVPIVSNGAVLGAVSLCYSGSRRSYGAHDVPAAQRLARRLAAVLGNGLSTHAPFGLRATARHARQGTTIRRRLASRN
jgi:GAF domain-containing protein